MNIADEIRQQIEKNKALKLDVGAINNRLSILEELVRKDIEERVDEAYQKGREDGKKYGLDESDMREAVSYQRGLDDAWDAARKIIHMPEGELLNIFTECYSAVCTAIQVILKYDASEALEKLKAYEEKQKADDEIKVGDEVKWHSNVIVVTRLYKDGGFDWCDGIGKDGRAFHVLAENVRKTGRHFDIASILEDMKE